MIPERHMKQARRCDNGEMVQGNIITEGSKMYIKTPSVCARSSMDSKINDNFVGFYAHRVYPATVEDVEVKPVIGENGNIYCPNCKNKIGAFRGRNYCPGCGMRILWEE